MTITASLLAYLAAASLLTITPGVDTALVLRAATVEGMRQAIMGALGINLGCLFWGIAVALGLGALIVTSPAAYEVLTWLGAGYLVWLGVQLFFSPRRHLVNESGETGSGRFAWFWRGLFGNLLNPKVGVFYVSFLPQFVPQGVAVAPYTLLLALIHIALGLIWCALLIVATRPLGRALRRPKVIAFLDRLTGTVFIGFGVKLALSAR
jgi:threonine/homoserine/homoserine lactone efflux protein